MALGRKRSTVRVKKTEDTNLDGEDEVTNALLRTQHSKRTLLRIRTGTRSTKYETARGRSIYWDAEDEKRHEVKVFIRDTSVLKDSDKWEQLVSKGVTHLVIEDNENNLKAIPQDVCNIQTLRSFTLMWSKVKGIPDYIFQLPLTEFCLHKCPLKNVNEIYLMRNLVTLELANTGLKKLPARMGELTNLVNLDLPGNHFTSLPDSMSTLRKLKVLKVSGNDFSTIPACVLSLVQLDMVDFSHNHITSIPDGFGALSQLVTLRMSHNQIAVLPESFTKLKSLRFLYLRHNQFTEVPSSLSSLPNLETLNMVSNKIGSMQAPIEALMTLLLDRNELESLPQPIFNCSRLEKLSVEFNRLTTIPAQIARLSRLRALYIGGNKFTHLPDDICTLSNLRHLVLRESSITELPPRLDRLENLSVVDIEDTQLDGRYQYAVKKEGIKGLMEQVALMRDLKGVDDHKSNPETDSFDRGSSIFDSEDEPDVETEKPAEKDHPPVATNKQTKLRDNNTVSRRHQIKSIFPRQRPQTLMPNYDYDDEQVVDSSL